MKIAIITPHNMIPPSMRVEQMKNIIEKQGYAVDVINTSFGNGVFKRLLELRKKISISKSYDTYIVYDLLTLIFLIDFIFINRKKIIYDVIDFFPGYYSYKLGLRGVWLKIGIFIVSKIEYILVKYILTRTIVNSQFLEKYLSFSNKLVKILYSSPFEDYNIRNNPIKDKIAGLYLGLFSIEKGAMTVIDFAKNNKKIPIFVIGDFLLDNVELPSNIIRFERMNKKLLSTKMAELMQEYFLLGFSTINTDNPSYAVQEANKDIDYLCCGIPIVGNSRYATKEKIEQGCGIFYDNIDALFEIIYSQEQKKLLSNNAYQLYMSRYHSCNSLLEFKKIL